MNISKKTYKAFKNIYKNIYNNKYYNVFEKLLFVIIIILLVYFCYKLFSPDTNTRKSIGISTTVKNPHQLNDWIKYHLNIGFDKLFIVFDDENEAPHISNANVVIFKNDHIWKNELKQLPDMEGFINDDKEVMSRQILNFTNVRNDAKRYNIDWLLHIDSDELFYPEDNNLENIFDNKYDIKSYKNYEMIPSKDDYTNCFKEGINFKINGQIFNAYGNGKSAVKVKSNAKISGVHEFYNGDKLDSKIGKILHYPSCNFNEYVNKYKILGKFSDKWWGTNEIPFKFHKESRDIITSCKNINSNDIADDTTDDCINKIREFYNKNNVLNDSYKSTDIKLITFVQDVIQELNNFKR